MKDKAPGICKHAKKQGWEEQYSHSTLLYHLLFQGILNHNNKKQDTGSNEMEVKMGNWKTEITLLW